MLCFQKPGQNPRVMFTLVTCLSYLARESVVETNALCGNRLQNDWAVYTISSMRLRGGGRGGGVERPAPAACNGDGGNSDAADIISALGSACAAAAARLGGEEAEQVGEALQTHVLAAVRGHEGPALEACLFDILGSSRPFRPFCPSSCDRALVRAITWGIVSR